MEQNKKSKSLDWIRRIRDQQAKELEGKSHQEIIEYYKSAFHALRHELKALHIGSDSNDLKNG